MPANQVAPIVATVSADSEDLKQVIALWRTNRATLGLFPKGAFDSYARKGGVYAATTGESEVVGYFVFRASRGWARLVHFCVHKSCRGTGVAEAMMTKLRELSLVRGLQGITLRCRRDFEQANRTWERLGFVPRADVPGRSLDGTELTVWVLSHNLPDLFSIAKPETDDRLQVAIDANILYDLFDEWNGRNKEALVLKEPWMTDAVQLCVTEVIHLEINNCQREDQRRHYRNRAHVLRELASDPSTTEGYLPRIEEIMGWNVPSLKQQRDMLHLAKAAVGEAAVFLTRDGELIERAGELELLLGVRVMRPSELVSWLDEAERGDVYEPVRLAGTDITFEHVTADGVRDWNGTFQAADSGESRKQFEARVHAALARLRSGTTIHAARMGSSDWLSLVAEHSADSTVTLEMLRLARSRWSATLARHHLLQCVLSASKRGFCLIRVTDPHLSQSVVEALRELHFIPHEGHWVRILTAFCGAWSEGRKKVVSALNSTIGSKAEIERLLPPADRTQIGPAQAASLEDRFWPLTILGEGLPNYLIPIQRVWAAPLFDADLARRELFGAPLNLALNRENVYYRSSRQRGITAPGRILWYVSGKDPDGGTMAVRACSRLVEVNTGSVKEIFRRYRRIGIYEWKQAVAITKGDPEKEIMALRFADTKTFSRPVPLAALAKFGIRAAPMSPRKLTDAQFMGICQIADILPQ